MKNITVIGAGTMGNGIAHVFAHNGYEVQLYDINETALEKAVATVSKNMDRQITKGKLTKEEKEAALNRLKIGTNLEHALSTVDLVVEAATENKELKFKIFKELDRLAPVDCILASNTSSISITEIAAQTNRPGKVIGMHFMNPVPVMKLVEIIRGYSTSDKVCNQVIEMSSSLQKIPVACNDYPGFVANRILMPMINEAIISLHESVAGVQEIDSIMKLGMAHPMGPLQLADFIGLDVCLSILNVLHDGLGNPKYAPCPLLVNMVNAGKLGVKSKEGFYDYSNGVKEAPISSQFK
jgi:3-hydroxybutyryl-CoA dehydrogenase